MRTIHPTAILAYYDGVEVFTGADAIGGNYIGAFIDAVGDADRYLVVGVRPERLRELRMGMLDLRTLLLEAPGGEWYLTLVNGNAGQPLALEPQSGPLEATDFLPDPGFLLDYAPVDDLALQYARARGNVVFEFSVEPPETANGHRVRMATLGGLLLQVQSVVKYAYLSALRELSDKTKSIIDTKDGHLMDAIVSAAPGSYRVILEAAKPPDMFGYGEVARGLQLLDEIFGATNPDKALETLQKHKGRLAGSYIKLMRFLSDNDTGLSYSWAHPDLPAANYGGVSGACARQIAEMLSDVTSLTTESVTLTGEFERVNRRRGDWGLLTDDGIKTGNIADGGPSLNGLEVGKRYRFLCQEDTELDAAGREKQTLYLVDIEPEKPPRPISQPSLIMRAARWCRITKYPSKRCVPATPPRPCR